MSNQVGYAVLVEELQLDTYYESFENIDRILYGEDYKDYESPNFSADEILSLTEEQLQQLSASDRQIAEDLQESVKALMQLGIHIADVHDENIGVNKHGNTVILDLGATKCKIPPDVKIISLGHFRD